MKPKIVVVGSSNTDLVLKLPGLPKPGETIIGGTFSTAQGGKGANQAVAASRVGGDVTFITKVGNDLLGTETLRSLNQDSLDLRFTRRHPTTASGVAFIFVDEKGENCIGVASGANSELLPADIEDARAAITSADILLVQLEVPLATVQAAAKIASAGGVRFLLNPAPAQELQPSLLNLVSVIIPNEHEAGRLTGIEVIDEKSAAAASSRLRMMGVSSVVVTLGSRGAFIDSGDAVSLVAPFTVNAVDTTAAGDVFCGALAVGLAEGKSLEDASRLANAAGAISVTRPGAQPSAPSREEIEQLLAESWNG